MSRRLGYQRNILHIQRMSNPLALFHASKGKIILFAINRSGGGLPVTFEIVEVILTFAVEFLHTYNENCCVRLLFHTQLSILSAQGRIEMSPWRMRKRIDISSNIITFNHRWSGHDKKGAHS